MRKTISTVGLTALMLVVLDLVVAGVLAFAESRDRLPAINWKMSKPCATGYGHWRTRRIVSRSCRRRSSTCRPLTWP